MIQALIGSKGRGPSRGASTFSIQLVKGGDRRPKGGYETGTVLGDAVPYIDVDPHVQRRWGTGWTTNGDSVDSRFLFLAVPARHRTGYHRAVGKPRHCSA